MNIIVEFVVFCFTTLSLGMVLRIFKHDARRRGSNVYYVIVYTTQRLLSDTLPVYPSCVNYLFRDEK
jgi:hypothetical protein